MNPTNALYQSLLDAYGHFNTALFDGKLPPVMFTVQRQKELMGYFAPDRWTSLEGTRCHEIGINPANMGRSRVVEVLQTLVHEMVHCWQYIYGKPSRSCYHNTEWAYKMIDVGLQPSDTGLPGGAITGQHMNDYPIEGGRFLLACHALVKSNGFNFPWIYRFMLPNSYAIAHQAVESLPLNTNLERIKTETAVVMADFNPEALSDEAVTQYLYSSYQDILPKDTLVQLKPAPKTKSKYQCPGCQANVWGKAGLDIVCGRCQVPFDVI